MKVSRSAYDPGTNQDGDNNLDSVYNVNSRNSPSQKFRQDILQ